MPESKTAERTEVDRADERSMRLLEYAVCALAGIGALLLCLIH